MKQEERTYMILDSQNNPIAPGQMVSPPGDEMLQVLVLENKIDDVARHEIIHLIAMGRDDASLQCQVLRVACRGEAGLAEGEQVELVVPTVEAPLIMRCQILRVKELQDEKRLYATKFIDMCEDEEVTVRETVFSLQLQSRNQRIGSE